MDSMIHIGNKYDKKTVAALTEGIAKIFKVGKNTHMEQETIRFAIGAFMKTAEVQSTTLSGCSLTNK